jgi:hypothetical protein
MPERRKVKQHQYIAGIEILIVVLLCDALSRTEAQFTRVVWKVE